ncbi:hypothetical protein LMG28614_05626 [Paraburkholderia ultramafica]|uniref:LamG-like jellyroll fold domain-containing protein n=1 Tax=Paraburkholderia ultramafica TaxID=1544867 RepID=A0A6S7C6N2_9BURK|nr:LamG domain-containing protein [Paraburkholderia ultramafica]CAB3802509.1 hypothetical protein LMG28614_05626 [Paraburkholderia ultramafica]
MRLILAIHALSILSVCFYSHSSQAGTVSGPVSSVVGNVVLWNDTTGTTVSDSGTPLQLNGLADVTYQTGGSPSNLIMGQKVTLASGATQNVFVGELAGATAANSTLNTKNNTAIGYTTMSSLTSGSRNTALGAACLLDITSGTSNVAIGPVAMQDMTTGHDNIGIGDGALSTYTTAQYNIGMGANALAGHVGMSGDYNIGIGANTGGTLTTGSSNILIGYGADVPSSSTSNFLNIDGVIFATGMTGSVSSPAGKVGIGTASPAVSLDLSQNTDALALPVGTTGQRPTGTNGEIRYNSTTAALEAYIGGAWASLGTGSSVSGDAFWNNVVFMPRAAASNTGTDVSGNAVTLTLTGMTTSSSTTKQDTYSWICDGTHTISAASSVPASLLSGDFTIEFWYYQTANGADFYDAQVTNGFDIEMTSTNTPTIHQNNVGNIIVSSGGNTSLNAWHHLAAVRQGGEMYLWIDGALKGTAANTTIFPAGSVSMCAYTGYQSAIRVSKFARYIATFTPPTTPFPTTMLGGP